MRSLIGIFTILVAAVLVFAFRKDITNAVSTDNKSGNSTMAVSMDGKQNSNNVTIARKWDLPSRLLEISALSRIDDNRLACIQDEEGTIFIYDLTKGNVEREIAFGSPGDYEGLAVVGEGAWVLRSDGHLFEISSLTGEKPVVKEYDTPLTASHNTEGLCYDSKNNRLLIAVKENDPSFSGKKGIYSFDLTSKTMNSSPAFTIDLNHDLIVNASGSSKKKIKEGNQFMPSAIAIHPVSGDIHITDGRNPKLMVMDATGKVKDIYQLDKKDFNQPEGITFTSNGDMFISNEGTKKPGNILEVKLK